MGTDIHLYVERRENGQWVSCDTWESDEYIEKGEAARKTVPFGKHFYHDRNYDLFAMLADVRNGFGFAGAPTGAGFVPISKPRGIPTDLSPELAAEVAVYMEHTPSWLLVSELMAYDWTQVSTKTGWVTAAEFHQWTFYNRERGLGPKSYCGGVSGPRIEHVTEKEMQRRIDAITARMPDTTWHAKGEVIAAKMENVYCDVSWQTPYYRAASDFLSECLPRLWRLGKPEDVRIVFWFDS